jgi:hypothetical protein
VLGDLPNLINAQEDVGTLNFWSLNHTPRPDAAPDRLDERDFRAALRECRTLNTKQNCPPYIGYGFVAPVIQRLPPSGTNWLQATPRDVVIIVTDLQPDDQDAPGDGGKIGKALRDIVERGDRAVGLVGVRSRFFGPVNDLPGGQTSDPLEGAQPFFLVIIGPPRVVNRLQSQLITNLPAPAPNTDPHPASHAEIFTRHDRQMMAQGRWVGVIAREGKKQKLLLEATALDVESGRQFVVPSRAAVTGATLVEFRYELPKTNADPRRMNTGVSVVATPTSAEPTVHVWMPLDSHAGDCSRRNVDQLPAGWRRRDGSPLKAEAANEKIILKVGEPPLEPGFLYFSNLQASVRGSAGARSFPWVKLWTVKGDWHDAWEDFRAGRRDVLGVANLDTMLQILSIAERQTHLDRPNDRIPFVFRVED